MIAQLKSRLGPHQWEVLSGTALAFLLRGSGAVLAFGLNIAIGRLLGAEGAGLYFLALSVVTIGAVVTQMGLANALLRFVASAAAQSRWDQVNGVVHLGLGHAVLSGLCGAVLVGFGAPWIAEIVFAKPELAGTLRMMSLGVLSFSLMLLISECLKGLKHIRNAMLVNGVLYPAIALILLWPLAHVFGPSGAALAYVTGTAGAALIGWVLWRRGMPPHPQPASFDRETLRTSSRPLWAMSIINRAVLPLAPLFLLGIWGSTAEAGVFGAAARVALLMAFFLLAVNTVIAPKFAELHMKGDRDNLGFLAGRFSLLITVAASPLFVILIIWNTEVMGLFGEEFRIGGPVLVILVLGQAVNTVTGTAGHLLMMTGHERDMRNAALVGAGLMIAVGLALVPGFGMVGAALAMALANAVMNGLSAWLAWRRLGILTLPLWRKGGGA